MPWGDGGLLEPDGGGSGGSSGSGIGTSGGSGPPGGGGGIGSYPPILPAPGEGMFKDLDDSLGASSKGGVQGSQSVYSEIPGDLGSLYMNLNRFLLLAESKRENQTFIGLVSYNHRFRGHREAHKFNLFMQKLLTICSSLYLDMNTANNSLRTQELQVYPTDTEITEVYHVYQQIRFKEWLLSKEEDDRWFS